VEKWSCVNANLKTAHRQADGSGRARGILDESRLNLAITQNEWAHPQPKKIEYNAA
jgi:hypothetical protein